MLLHFVCYLVCNWLRRPEFFFVENSSCLSMTTRFSRVNHTYFSKKKKWKMCFLCHTYDCRTILQCYYFEHLIDLDMSYMVLVWLIMPHVLKQFLNRKQKGTINNVSCPSFSYSKNILKVHFPQLSQGRFSMPSFVRGSQT